jgi:hypothetical protein
VTLRNLPHVPGIRVQLGFTVPVMPGNLSTWGCPKDK